MANSPAAEQQLIDKLNRLERTKTNSTVMAIRLSALSPVHKSPRQVKMVLSTINDTIVKTQSSLFLLSNYDIVIIGQNLYSQHINSLTASVQRIFQSDSFASAHLKEFIQTFSTERDPEKLKAFTEKYMNGVNQEQPVQKKEVPLAPEYLDAILRNIQGFNILKIIRRQEAIQITPQGRLASLFLEYFTSMSDLKKAIAPDVNVLSNRWLFQHLSQTLDKRMLGVSKELFTHTPKNISLNLNISTVFTPAFETFLSEAPENMAVIVEVQLMDIIQNTHNFIIARDLLHEAGHKILIDGLPPISFEFVDMNMLDADFMKLNWSAALANPTESRKLEKSLKDIDPERLILMRCEDETALAWALMHKITRFQGYFIDALTAAKIRKGCSEKKRCTREACSSRKAAIAGALRADCLIPSNLDLPIEYKRKKSE